jgi:hypothetical protein
VGGERVCVCACARVFYSYCVVNVGMVWAARWTGGETGARWFGRCASKDLQVGRVKPT